MRAMAPASASLSCIALHSLERRPGNALNLMIESPGRSDEPRITSHHLASAPSTLSARRPRRRLQWTPLPLRRAPVSPPGSHLCRRTHFSGSAAFGIVRCQCTFSPTAETSVRLPHYSLSLSMQRARSLGLCNRDGLSSSFSRRTTVPPLALGLAPCTIAPTRHLCYMESCCGSSRFDGGIITSTVS